MRPINQHAVVLGFGLAGLVFTNLAADVGLCWPMLEMQHNWHWLNEAVTGVLIGQIILIGFWPLIAFEE